MIDIKFQIGGKLFLVEPQHDITAYEAAQLFKLIMVCTNSLTPSSDRATFINQHNLLRHFKEVEL